ALAIVSGMTELEFRQFIHAGDANALSRIPGVGKKTAERLIIEMRDRIDNVAPLATGSGPLTVEASARSEAYDALVALGYKANEVNKLIGKLDTNDKSAEDIIRQALRQVAH
ncbi:MAG: Holliday junction branch migration protein RuvA, partial [Gammaproteobacteria bacterium]|nr:Holliday junction branch migration protein RuvA [Gammaproteobacteria bacterium]